MALGALVVALAWSSRGWPLIHDAAVMHYVAWLVGAGAVPYRDVFDMNAPGVYLVHLSVLRMLGDSDLAWRVVDLAWLALICGVMARFLWSVDAGAALVSSLLFAAYHLAGGPWLAGQRDFLLCLFLIGGATLLLSGAGTAPRAAAGLVAGGAIVLKPPSVVFLFLLAAASVRDHQRGSAGGVTGLNLVRRGPFAVVPGGALSPLAYAEDHQRGALTPVTARAERCWRDATTVLAGGAVVPLACAGWLAATGGLAAFAGTFTEYVLPLYSRLARVWPWTPLDWWPFGWPVWGLFAVLIALISVAGWQRPRRPTIEPSSVMGGGATATTSGDWDRRWRLIVAGVAYGLFHFVVQGKGWEYQLYPLALFACLAAGLALAAPDRAVRWTAAGAVALLTVTFTVKGAQETAPPWIADKAARVERLVTDLKPRLGRGDRVQVLDTNAGGVHALFRLRARQPTRFIYDFHFLHDEDRPAIRALRAEFVAALAAGLPAVIVILRDGWPSGGYERFERFPELARWLEDRYQIAADAGDYRIYVRRAGR